MKPHKSIRIFENPYLERLTHVHPVIPLIVWAPIVVFLAWRSVEIERFSVSGMLLTMAAGLFVWTLVEYVLHRYVFHFKPRNAWQKKLIFIMHDNHHVDPNDPTRLVMPPAGSLILGVILYSLFRLALGGAWVDPFFAGFVLGYLSYDYTHYAIHHFKPRTRFGKWVKHHHMLHHFVAPDAFWGVSSPLWDYAFGTLIQPSRAGHRSLRSGPASSVGSSSRPRPPVEGRNELHSRHEGSGQAEQSL